MNAPHSLPPDLQAWLDEHPEVDAADLAPTWRLAEGGDPTAAAPPPDPARIRAIETTLAQEAVGVERRPALRLVGGGQRWRPWLAAAAAVVLLMAAGLGWWLRPASLTAPAGQTLSAALPDGSQVQLNSGATLTYPRSFGDDARRVRLEGEGFFEVAPSGTPFVIETFNADVTVLGTQFNVRAWPDEAGAQTVVSVVSGTVQVAARQAQAEAIVLQAGQRSRVAADAPVPTPPAPARLDEATAWRDGSFVFYNQPLAVLFDEIRRRFGIDVTASETIRARPFTFSRRRVRNAEALVKDLCQAAQLRYRLTANGFLIFDANNDPPAYDG